MYSINILLQLLGDSIPDTLAHLLARVDGCWQRYPVI